MQLKEILTEVDLLAPNAVSTEHKVNFINQIQNEIFREVHLKTNSYYFQTVVGVELYDLPSDCQSDNVLELYVDDKEYRHKGIDSHNYGNLYTIVNDKILIQPTPDGQYDAYIYYDAMPAQLTADNLDAVPDFPSDYHEILTIGCAKKVAMIMKDYDGYKVLSDQYTLMTRDVVLKYSPKPNKVRRIRRWV